MDFPKFCTQCGNSIHSVDKFCSECGYRVSPSVYDHVRNANVPEISLHPSTDGAAQQSPTKPTPASKPITPAIQKRIDATNKEYSRKDADRINSRLIDPDISPIDATEQYKEIYELLGQHEEHLTTSQKNKLIQRASTLKNSHYAYTTHIDAALIQHQRVKDNYDSWRRENPAATNSEIHAYKQKHPNYIGSPEYYEFLNAPVSSHRGGHDEQAEKHNSEVTTQQSLQLSLETQRWYSSSEDHRLDRSRSIENGGYDKYIISDSTGKITSTLLMIPYSGYRVVKEKNGWSEAHHDDYKQFGHPQANNKYNPINKEFRPRLLSYHPEISKDTLLSDVADQYIRAKQLQYDSTTNIAMQQQALRTITAIEEDYPQIPKILDQIEFKAANYYSIEGSEVKRRITSLPPGPPPVSQLWINQQQYMEEVCIWAPGINQWILLSALIKLRDNPSYNEGVLISQLDFKRHFQGSWIKTSDHQYINSNHIIERTTTKRSHDGDVYFHGISGMLIGIIRDSDGSQYLNHQQTVSVALGEHANRILGTGVPPNQLIIDSNQQFSGGTFITDGSVEMIGHLDHIRRRIHRMPPPAKPLLERTKDNAKRALAKDIAELAGQNNTLAGAITRGALRLERIVKKQLDR